MYQEIYLSVDKQRRLYHLAIAALAALLLALVVVVAFVCVDIYVSAWQNTNTWLPLLTQKVIPLMEPRSKITSEDSYKRLDDGTIGTVDKSGYRLEAIPHSGFWNFRDEGLHTFTFSSIDAQVKNGCHQNGTE